MFRAVGRFNPVALKKVVHRNASTTSVPAITDIERKWKSLSTDEQNSLSRQLEEIQKQDWNKITVEEKKAAYYISFGPHGPREPLTKPGHVSKVIAGIGIIVAISTGIFYLTRASVSERPVTLTKEWQEATNEKLRGQNANPISGLSSEGYKGKGYVTEK
ncbi:15258_t:CDS:2 [Acaulospora colombiana]|uniref:15258_t:CDS:1 n=1 Tax=Acaulospora colombiana TaxID=27376 RepID=A0ACA9JY31_9GLOM|nr:15258_t:CDS:2 [Acaulospora colombiana]